MKSGTKKSRRRSFFRSWFCNTLGKPVAFVLPVFPLLRERLALKKPTATQDATCFLYAALRWCSRATRSGSTWTGATASGAPCRRSGWCPARAASAWRSGFGTRSRPDALPASLGAFLSAGHAQRPQMQAKIFSPSFFFLKEKATCSMFPSFGKLSNLFVLDTEGILLTGVSDTARSAWPLALRASRPCSHLALTCNPKTGGARRLRCSRENKSSFFVWIF